jgi:hypothetical protein
MKKAGLLLCGAAVAASIALLDAQTTVSGVFFVEGWESGTLSGSFNSAYYGNSSSSQFRVQNGRRWERELGIRASAARGRVGAFHPVRCG